MLFFKTEMSFCEFNTIIKLSAQADNFIGEGQPVKQHTIIHYVPNLCSRGSKAEEYSMPESEDPCRTPSGQQRPQPG